jgi:diadenosine tetraphosphate (Ap4A) HIT family hydrolase
MKYTEHNCPFCQWDTSRGIILKSENAFAIFDKFPVSQGHALIIPNRHTSNYFDLSPAEQSHCIQLLNEVKQKVSEQFSPDGFNVGINVNEAAGQTVPHVHIHLIPRYHGDVANPLGGVRGVIPDKKEY